MNSLFETFLPDDIRALIAQHPLAWVTVGAEGVEEPSLLPMVGEYDDEGRLTGLIGHLAKRNPLCSALQREGRARFLFCGPEGYVSPAEAGRRDWAPTWNYASLRVEAQVEVSEAYTRHAIDVLADKLEVARAQPWSAVELGPRYDMLSQAIIGFRARVTSLRGIFKLGQDESAATFALIAGSHENPELVEWMRRFDERKGDQG